MGLSQPVINADRVGAAPVELPSRATEPSGYPCEQAVFTSVRSATGQGYRLIAAGKGLSPADKKEISTRSPSHDGLCDPGPNAFGLACYPLADERICVAFSCAAGPEHTGRGGQRIFTRIVVLEPRLMAGFEHNSFMILEAMRAAGLCQPDLRELDRLEPVCLIPSSPKFPSTEASGSWNRYASALAFILERLLDGDRVVIRTPRDPFSVAEALINSLPIPWRTSFSFSCNLRYSVSRGANMQVVSDDFARTERLARGQGVCTFDLGREVKRESVVSPWIKLVAGRWAKGQVAHLALLTGRQLDSRDRRQLDEIGGIGLDLDRIGEMAPMELLDLLRSYHDQAPTTSAASELAVDVRLSAARRLTTLAGLRGNQFPPAWYRDLLTAYRTDLAPPEALAPAVSAVLDEMRKTTPLTALEYGLTLVEFLPKSGIASKLLDTAFRQILDSLTHVIPQVPPAKRGIVFNWLVRWSEARPEHSEAQRLLKNLAPDISNSIR